LVLASQMHSKHSADISLEGGLSQPLVVEFELDGDDEKEDDVGGC
jgi:hypothetical protein